MSIWPFSKEAKPKEPEEPSEIEKLQAWRSIGDTFEYLGRKMVVTGHYHRVSIGYASIPIPKLYADYADNNGRIRNVSFTPEEIEAIQRTQP